ncbi:MAG: hypothetical protein GY850_17460 [bacterium]|nr:hypothetical protein [bacterium]
MHCRIITLVILAIFCLPLKTLAAQITFIGTGDLQGFLEPFETKIDTNGGGKKEKQTAGGIARIGTLIRNIKAENKGGVMVLSAGDDLMNRYFHTFKGEAIYRLMSMAGYDVIAFGNHEFDKGPHVLAKALKHTTFQVVCSDLNVRQTPLEGLCLPLLIKKFGSVKVGFFSLMTESFPFVTSGGNIRLTGSNIESAQKAVTHLRKKGVDIVVGLTHIGFENDLEVARTVEGIDVIFGAHSHDYLGGYKRIGNTLIVNGGEKGVFLVRFDIAVDSDGKIDFDKVTYDLIPVTEKIPPATDIDARLAEYRKSFPAAIVVGKTDVEWNLTKQAIRMGESQVADLVNDLMRKKFHAEIVLNNAGAFRGKKAYPPGPITDTMLKEIDEFGNYAFLLDLPGKYVREILEHSAASFGEGGLLHPSGLRYAIDLTKPAQTISQDTPKELNVVARGQRVMKIRVLQEGQWAPLDPEKTYRVLTNAYLVDQQGDGYFWFKRFGKNLQNTYSTFYSILAEAAGNQPALNPPQPDGRVKVIR